MKLLDSKTLKLMIESASNQILNNVEKINDMNVFPVPDGDTGTNMSLTFSAAAKSAMELDESRTPFEIMESLSKSSLRNARGNSGVILSQILRGLRKGLEGFDDIGVSEIKRSLCFSRDIAYRAVMKPTEGTILTVIREMAEFAEEHFSEYDDVVLFMKDVRDAGNASLDRTPEILPVLKQAGVVDAGGCGVMTLLSGAVSVLETGVAVELKSEAKDQQAKTSQVIDTESIDTSNIKFKYCTEFLINKKSSDRSATQFMASISPKGDCMLVIDDDDIVKVHIHTNNPGFVIEQAIKLGELTNLKIDNMKYQHNKVLEENQESKLEVAPEPPKKYGFVSVSSGSGMSELFESLGCDKIVQGGQTMNPSTQDLLNAVDEINARNVFIFPNNKNIILAAEQVDRLCDKNVVVIPTKNMPQGISALACFSDEQEVDENIQVMREYAGLVKCGQITYAARNSHIDGLDIEEGDIMAVVGSDVTIVGKEIEQVVMNLADNLVDDESGIISVYYGEDVGKEEAEEIVEKLETKYRDLDINLNYGGQSVYYYIMAVEDRKSVV